MLAGFILSGSESGSLDSLVSSFIVLELLREVGGEAVDGRVKEREPAVEDL